MKSTHNFSFDYQFNVGQLLRNKYPHRNEKFHEHRKAFKKLIKRQYQLILTEQTRKLLPIKIFELHLERFDFQF